MALYDVEFHISIAKSFHNSILFDLYKYITNYIHKVIHLLIQEPGFNHNLNLLHYDLYTTIKEKNPSKAEETLLNIIRLDKENLSRNTED